MPLSVVLSGLLASYIVEYVDLISFIYGSDSASNPLNLVQLFIIQILDKGEVQLFGSARHKK